MTENDEFSGPDAAKHRALIAALPPILDAIEGAGLVPVITSVTTTSRQVSLITRPRPTADEAARICDHLGADEITVKRTVQDDGGTYDRILARVEPLGVGELLIHVTPISPASPE